MIALIFFMFGIGCAFAGEWIMAIAFLAIAFLWLDERHDYGN